MTVMNIHIGVDIDEYLQENEKLIFSVANRYQRRGALIGLELDDLVQVGTIGFIKAYQRFDPTSFLNEKGEGVQFSTYAIPAIEGEIQRYLRDQNPVLKFPRTIKELSYKVQKQKLHNASIPEIAETLDVSIQMAEDVIIYLESRVPIFLGNYSFQSSQDDSSITLLEEIMKEEDFSSMYVHDFISSLGDRDQAILKLRLQDKTQKEIGEELGYTQVHIGRLLSDIQKKYIRYLNGTQ